MREIKFRAYNQVTKEWSIDLPTIFKRRPFDKTDYPIWGYMNEGALAVMQYIGVHDKDGKEIYEGDLLSLNGNGKAIEVKWDTKEQGWLPKVLEGDTAWKVVGNIYDNPVLVSE